MKTENAVLVANELKTRYEHKGHGGYNIYEDDKIEIAYDTYYPNLTIYVKDGEKKILALLHSGHGYDQEYHPGKWELYINEILLPLAVEARKKREADKLVRKAKEQLAKNHALNDDHIFNGAKS